MTSSMNMQMIQEMFHHVSKKKMANSHLFYLNSFYMILSYYEKSNRYTYKY